MADQYLTAAYVRGHLGTAYDTAVTSITGVSQTVLFESATSVIQTALRNSGYSPVSTEDATDVEEFVKLATLGCYRELLATIPEGAIPLPEAWESNPAKLALRAILSGDAKLAATPSNAGAVGGWQMTENDPDVDDSRAARATRDELAGW